ncbi:HAMP domain-containing histidine kinase [Pedobacter sp. PAMC26386]|nr:HAMP domain-containing histidine kinase [Pedobacter sp. PAMC26386]
MPKIKDSLRYVDALNRIAMLSHLRYRDSCLYYAEKAKEISYRHDYLKGIADAENCQGIYYFSVNNYLSAKYFNNSLRIYRSINDKQNVAQVLMNMGLMMAGDHNEKEALKYIYQAEDISRSLVKDSIRSLIISNLLTIDKSLTPKQYKRLFKEGRAISRKYKDERLLIFYDASEGTRLYKAGEKQRGLAMLKAASQRAEDQGLESVKVETYGDLADIMLDLKKDDLAEDYYKKGLDTSEEFGFSDDYIYFAEKLFEFYKSRHLHEKAYQYVTLLLAKQNQLADAVNKSGYNYQNFSFRETENADLKARATTRIKTILLLACLSVSCIGLIFFIYRALRIKKEYGEAQQKLLETASRQNKELQQANHFNTMLISVIAHDIRQPFSTIVMLSSVFEMLSDEEKSDMMVELSETSQKSLSFMDGLLDWIKSQSSNFNYQPDKLMLRDLIVEANTFFKIAQKKKAIELSLKVSDQDIVLSDKQMLLFIVRNILNNATKYSPVQGVIQISSQLDGEVMLITIRDQGPGMSNEQLDRLFKSGTSDLEKIKDKGAGLALLISHEMASMMGMKIWASSELGKGTAFHLSVRNSPVYTPSR